MDTFLQDLRHSLRALAKAPGYTAVAVLTLALGVGANAAIFSVLQAVVLRDLPYREPDRIAVMWTRNIRQNLPDGTSYLNFRDWKAQTRQFSAMAAYVRPEFTRNTLGGNDTARIQVGLVGEGFFELLGATPVLGRTFTRADFNAKPRAIVISHGLWQQRYGGDPRIIGRSVLLGDATVDIVGVMPREFELPVPDVQLWQPLWFGAEEQKASSRADDVLVVLGRLAPTATIDSARAEMDAIAAGLRERYPATNAAFGVLTDRLVDRVTGATTERSLWLLFGSVGFVLLIACTNVANLVLSRAVARRHEFSLRTALGAGSWRLARQVLTESLALAILAGGCGLLLAWAGTSALRSLAPGALPRAESIHMDAGVVLFLLTATLACGLLAGLIPALQLSMVKPAEVLREAGPRAMGGRGGRRLHEVLVIAEIALAVMLMAGAGLLMRSFVRVQSTQRGFDSSNLLLLQVDMPRLYYTDGSEARFFSEATRRLRALPGVVAVGAISDFFIHRQPDKRIALEGQPPRLPDEPAPPLTEDVVIPGYFEAMRIPVIRGRTLNEGDLAPGAPQMVVINEEMARRYWPGQDPIGRRLKYGLDPGASQPWKTVVGIVADMRRQRLDEPAIPYMFRPGVLAQMDLVVRTAGDPERWREAIRAEIRAIDPMAPPYGIITVEQRLGRTVALRRLQTMLLLALAGVALTLAMIGAYGVIHQSVTARTREIGVRLALGASATAVVRMVLAGGLAPAVAGLGLGLLGSLALSRTLATFLYDTSALDPLIYGSVTAVLLMVATAACLAPARRAARFDPVIALRRD